MTWPYDERLRLTETLERIATALERLPSARDVYAAAAVAMNGPSTDWGEGRLAQVALQIADEMERRKEAKP